MDLLISNQVESRAECFVFMGIFYIQILSSFFAPQIKVFDPVNSTSDKLLNYLQEIFRFKDLFINKFHSYKAIITFFLHLQYSQFFVRVNLALVLYPSGLRGWSAKPLVIGSNPIGTLKSSFFKELTPL